MQLTIKYFECEFEDRSWKDGEVQQLRTPFPFRRGNLWVYIKLQALVYDILPSTTAVFSYAIGLKKKKKKKLSSNEQFFVGAQTVVNLLQTSQIKQGVSFTAANKVYTSTNTTTIV